MGGVASATLARRGIISPAKVVSSVEAILEFGEVARNVLFPRGAVGSNKGRGAGEVFDHLAAASHTISG
jgi:hypothetical protein